MICSSVNTKGSATDLANDPAEIRVKVGFHFGLDQRTAMFGAESEMHQQICSLPIRPTACDVGYILSPLSRRIS
jgi:hypothetical protein